MQGKQGLVAHEFVLDCKDFKKTAGIEIGDIAKRLMDYGYAYVMVFVKNFLHLNLNHR